MSELIEYCHVLPNDDEWIGKSTKQSQTLPENSGLVREHAGERGTRKYHTKTPRAWIWQRSRYWLLAHLLHSLSLRLIVVSRTLLNGLDSWQQTLILSDTPYSWSKPSLCLTFCQNFSALPGAPAGLKCSLFLTWERDLSTDDSL